MIIFMPFNQSLIFGFMLYFYDALKMPLSEVRLERGPKVAIIRVLTIKVPATSICTGISSATSADPVEESVKAEKNEPMTSR